MMIVQTWTSFSMATLVREVKDRAIEDRVYEAFISKTLCARNGIMG